MTPEEKIQRALDFAIRYGQIEGGHHRLWVIDQMVRALTGCPLVEQTAIDFRGETYTFEAQGENDEYRELIKSDDEEDSEWDTGIAP